MKEGVKLASFVRTYHRRPMTRAQSAAEFKHPVWGRNEVEWKYIKIEQPPLKDSTERQYTMNSIHNYDVQT